MGYAQNYTKKISELLSGVKISSPSSSELTLDESVTKVVEILKKTKESENKVFFIGNGASAALSSHHSADYSKEGIPSLCFSDPSLLTCMSNDYGYERVFEKPIRIFSKEGDVLFAISSSGESENILKAVETAKEKGLTVVTLSGFSESNKLRALGNVNFYVPSKTYGLVETVHTTLCHLILDAYLETKLGGSDL